MSGGHYDYAFGKISALAEAIIRESHEDRAQGKMLRRAFAKQLKLIADAAYELEWADSGDTDWTQAEAALRKVLAPCAEMEVAAEEARAAYRELGRLLGEVQP